MIGKEKGRGSMGTFAGLFCEQGCCVPEEKRQEFAKRVEKVFQAGGMMEVNVGSG